MEDIQRRFDLFDSELTYSPRYNIAPTQPVLAVTNDEERQPAYLRWGLIPSWAKSASVGNRLINARAETVTERPSFRTALARRRCLVIADGFYEWRRVGNTKKPMRVVMKSGELFAFAGLWDSWRNPEGDPIGPALSSPPNPMNSFSPSITGCRLSFRRSWNHSGWTIKCRTPSPLPIF